MAEELKKLRATLDDAPFESFPTERRYGGGESSKTTTTPLPPPRRLGAFLFGAFVLTVIAIYLDLPRHLLGRLMMPTTTTRSSEDEDEEDKLFQKF